MYGTVHHQRSNSTMATEPEGGGNHGTEEVEVETVLKQFDHWQEAVMSLQRTRSDLADKLETKGKENQELRQRNDKLQKELTDMHEAVESIQKQLQYTCTLQDDVESLKSHLQLKKQNSDDLNKKLADMQKKHEKEIVELKEKQDTDMQTAVESIKAEGQLLIDKLNQALFERDITINGLHDQIQQAQSEKQAEVVRITMEFESKMARLQRQKSQSSSSAQSSAAAQEIFRKKLQFMKAESEREISALKQTIAELRQKVTNLQREPTKLSLSIGKKRRY